tara:strand:+ start:312 stop:482 length:171 start_codon:yes stop_codon:yes gene_type:complete
MASIPINGSPRFTDTDVNSIDGTSGDWQFELGDDKLYVINKRDNRRYKIILEEVEE